MALSLRSCGRAGVGALRWLVGRALCGWSRPFPGLSSSSSFCRRLCAMDGVWWMIAAILRQIAAARNRMAPGRCRRCGPGSPISFRLDTHVRCWAVSESPRMATRWRPRFHRLRSKLGGAGQHLRRGWPRSQSWWQHVSLSPACDDGAPGVARSCPRSGWQGAKRRSTQRTTTTIRVSVSDAPRCSLPSGPLSAMPAAEPARSRVIVPDGGSGCFLLSRTLTLHRSPILARTQGWPSLACQPSQS
jgi:hypothetical protein